MRSGFTQTNRSIIAPIAVGSDVAENVMTQTHLRVFFGCTSWFLRGRSHGDRLLGADRFG
jgi:hypothetical protein